MSLLLTVLFGSAGAAIAYLVCTVATPELPPTSYINVIGLVTIIFAGVGKLIAWWQDKRRNDSKD